jgi:hypothetical protein
VLAYSLSYFKNGGIHVSEEKRPGGWNLERKEDVNEITSNITEVLNRNGPAFPYGWTGRVEFILFLADGTVAANVSGAYASGEKARLRYRIELDLEHRHWQILSFVKLSEGSCANDCYDECIVKGRFPHVRTFEKLLKKFRLTECKRGCCAEIVRTNSIVTDHKADVYIVYLDDKKIEHCCFYRLYQDDYDCWYVSNWECPKDL